MIETALAIGFACVSAAVLLNVWRLVRGPDLPDRIIAVDTLYQGNSGQMHNRLAPRARGVTLESTIQQSALRLKA